MNSIEIDGFTYVTLFSNEVEEKIQEDFILICRKVFGEKSMDNEIFKRKFIDNIYGESIIVVVYDNKNMPVAARSFWRNDINSKLAYQPGNTCVLEEVRGRNIFTKMTNEALKFLSDECIIYNFPNKNSFSGYIKMGWEVLGSYHIRYFTSLKEYKKEFNYLIDDKYLEWWILPKKNQSFFVTKKNNKILLVKKDEYRRLNMNYFLVIGEISERMSVNYEEINPILLFYRSTKSTIYGNLFKAINVVIKNKTEIDLQVPLFKIDAI